MLSWQKATFTAYRVIVTTENIQIALFRIVHRTFVFPSHFVIYVLVGFLGSNWNYVLFVIVSRQYVISLLMYSCIDNGWQITASRFLKQNDPGHSNAIAGSSGQSRRIPLTYCQKRDDSDSNLIQRLCALRQNHRLRLLNIWTQRPI